MYVLCLAVAILNFSSGVENLEKKNFQNPFKA